MNKYLKLFLTVFTLVFIFSACGKNEKLSESNINEKAEKGIIGNNYPVNRSLVSKMLSLGNYTKDEILAFERVIKFKDTKESEWYDKYINAIYIKGDMSGVIENEFRPSDNLTLNQTQYLIDKYDKSGKTKIKLNDKNKDKPISYALWCEIYNKIMKDFNIEEEELIILATSHNSKDLKGDFVITDKGLFSFEGFEPTKYLNLKIKVLKKGIEIIAITEVLEISPTLNRVYIKKIENKKITVFIGGAEKTFTFDNIEIGQDALEKLADIKFKNGVILDIDYYKTELTGNINKITENSIRIDNINYVLDEDFKIYSDLGGEIEFKDKDNLIIGQNLAKLFTNGTENKIYGAIINTEPIFDKVRILINNNNFTSPYFKEIKISSEGKFKLLVKGKEHIYSENQTVNIKNGEDFNIGENEIMIIEPLDKGKGIKIENIKRKDVSPIYLGKIEICKVDGKYTVINQVLFEEYVEGALTGSSQDLESEDLLKIMAILHRSMAVNLIKENKFYNYGANLDDSSKSQIYYTFNPNEKLKNAVKITNGKVIGYKNEIIKPNYFSHSGGTTANSGEIWAGRRLSEYPTEDKGYLKHKKLFKDFIYEDISDELNANIFFKSKDIDSLEKTSDWFRWTGAMEQNNLNQSDVNLKNIFEKYKNLVKIYKSGERIYNLDENIGKIKDIKSVKRGMGGNVMEIEIICENLNIFIISEIAVKEFFKLNFLIDNKGEKFENIVNVPSTYFVFDKIYDSQGYLKKLTFYGGGYGHGVGLSLNGAKELAENGMDYEEVLKQFYTDIEIRDIN